MIVLLRITYSDVQIYCNINKRETFPLKTKHMGAKELHKSFEQVSILRGKHFKSLEISTNIIYSPKMTLKGTDVYDSAIQRFPPTFASHRFL